MKLLLAAVLSLAVSAPQARIVSQGATAHRSVALTFDAGSDRGYAASILTTLEKAHLHATFGMTGSWARANPDLVKRIAKDGDTFMNHTYDHRSFTGFSSQAAPLTPAQRTWEIQQTERIIHKLTGRSTKPYYRPPYGDYDSATLSLLPRLGYRYMIMWTVDSLGWRGLSAPAILNRCLSLAKPGAIFLMHVGIQSHDAQALGSLITTLRRRGYSFVTIPQLVASS